MNIAVSPVISYKTGNFLCGLATITFSRITYFVQLFFFCASHPTGEISLSVSNAAGILTWIYSRSFATLDCSCFSA